MDVSELKLVKKLRGMDEYEFEELVADLWEGYGWSTTVTSDSNDRGIDVIAEKDRPVYQKQLIQAKRYSSNTTVGSRDIQQYSSLKHQNNEVCSVVVVTTNEFTSPAEKAVNDIDHMRMVDGTTLAGLIFTSNKNIIDSYIQDTKPGLADFV